MMTTNTHRHKVILTIERVNELTKNGNKLDIQKNTMKVIVLAKDLYLKIDTAALF